MIRFEKLLKETKIYKSLYQDAKAKNLSHCIMIVSEDVIACKNLCKLIARMLLCENDDCGHCPSCKQVEAGTNPSVVTPRSLAADDLKDFIATCYIKVDTDIKVALIDNFDEIRIDEQNRLLKLIEEPPGDTIFIMGVSKMSAVLETIKSRATKLYIEKFAYDDLKNALLQEKDAYNTEKAMGFAEGSITKAINIIENPTFIDSYNLALDIFNDMQRSSGLLDIVNRTALKNKRTQNDKAELLKSYLDAFELVIKRVVEYKSGVIEDVEDKIKQINEKYNMATLVNVEDLVIEAKKKVDNRCDADGVFYQMLMDILEVKFKCQL